MKDDEGTISEQEEHEITDETVAKEMDDLKAEGKYNVFLCLLLVTSLVSEPVYLSRLKSRFSEVYQPQLHRC